MTGIDLVQAQIRVAEGATIGTHADAACPPQEDIVLRGHALQCRITTEDPLDRFIPDYGRLTAYRAPTGFGIRLDGGTAYSGAVITRHYDSLLEKVTAWGPARKPAIDRMQRALREFRVRGVATNIAFLDRLIGHETFRTGTVTTRFIDEHPELLDFPKPRDRASRLLRYLAEVTVNGHRDVTGRPAPPAHARTPRVPALHVGAGTGGAKALLDARGPDAVAGWMLEQDRVLVTDTTMRDAHQSLLATRMRTYDLVRAAPAYARNLPGFFSLECWGGATFDVALRFLGECPWERLRMLRAGIPNILLQMLLRSSNAVGYTNYPDNVVRGFVAQAVENGVDLFRIFDPLNSVENMTIAIDEVRRNGAICETAMCYTADIHDPDRGRYDLDYYRNMAGAMCDAGTHVLGIKDMAGLLKPAAAREMVEVLKSDTGLPIHLHTHDTSGIAAASLLAAVDVGVDAIDLAMDSMSGLTSQPCLGSVVEALQRQPRDTGLDPGRVRELSDYWEAVRTQYAAFEPDLRSPRLGGPTCMRCRAGQFSNLREQARALGLSERWHEVASTYAEVNRMFGDIVKVTPTSKVVGDLALVMVSSGLSRADVEDPDREVAFPDSVVGLFRGELGEMPGGFPPALAAKVLKGRTPIKGRPGASLPPADLDAERTRAEAATGWKLSEAELYSYMLYPRVFVDHAERRMKFGPVSVLPTDVYFYGLSPGREVTVELERGLSLVIRCVAIGETDDEGTVRVFYELNGQPRSVKIENLAVSATVKRRPMADEADPCHVAAPMPGVIASVAVANGRQVTVGDLLMTIEAMKMETALHAERDGTISALHVAPGQHVEAKELVAEYAKG